MADLKTYRGNCHCTAFVFEIDVPEIKTVGECNCSICTRKGYLHVKPEKDHFRVVKGDVDDLSSYTFGSSKVEHKFCGHCGTGVLVDAPDFNFLSINAHVLQDFDTWHLEKKPFDGKALGSTYESHSHKGALPEVEVENGKIQTGSCHCGKVTVAVNVPPVDTTYPEKILECNCSICERGGYIWIYPPVPQVVLHASNPADLGKYHFMRGTLNKTFCKTCGVGMTNQNRPLSKEAEDALSDFDKKWLPVIRKINAVNVRVLNEVDLGQLPETEKSEGRQWPPVYVNP